MRRVGGLEARGITLMESLLAAAILATAAAVVIVPFSAGAQSVAQDARQTLAVSLAEGLMEEVLSKAFSDPDGSEAGENRRSRWDDMDDYHGYQEAEGAIVEADGTAVTDPAATALSRRVMVESVYVAGQDHGEPATFLRITVEVRHHGAPVVTLSRLKYSNE